MMVSMSGGVSMGGSAMGLGYVGVGVEGVSRLNPRAPDFAQRHPSLMQHKHNPQQMYSGGSNQAGNLSSLLQMSYQQQQQQQQPAPKLQHPPPHHPYQSLLEQRGVNVGASPAGGAWGDEEERKPRPIGTERAWKLTADDWHHHHQHLPDHDRYQQGVSGMGNVGAAVGHALDGGYGAGATAAALSLMHALPLQYLPPAPAPEPPHWEPRHPDKQTWSKWTH